MICELPCLQEIEINPLLVDEDGAIALDVRMLAGEVSAPGGAYSHMAIHPYPAHLLQTWRSADGHNITLRPIRPEDAAIEQDFVKNLSDESKYSRFMNTLQELSQSMLIRFTQIDYDREMALIATTADGQFPALLSRNPTMSPAQKTELVAPSGSSTLDREAMSLPAKLGTLPAPPGGPTAITVPITWRLN